MPYTDSCSNKMFISKKVDLLAHQYLYTDIPQHDVYDKLKKIWKQRKITKPVLSRMYIVSPTDRDRYFL